MPTAIITGAAGGIGRAMCGAFTDSGYRVIGIDRAAIDRSIDCEPVRFDIGTLGDNRARTRLAARLRRLLDGRVDVLVNNAAIQVVKPLAQITPADWNESLQVNLLAPFWLVQMLTVPLRRSHGSVVNVASIHAQATKAGFTAYSTSKGALVSLTRALALELAPDVRVNAVLPAATDTAMLRRGFGPNLAALDALGACHPIGRIAQPAEVAEVVVFLASPASRFLTGEAIRVDGGIGSLLHDPMASAARPTATVA